MASNKPYNGFQLKLIHFEPRRVVGSIATSLPPNTTWLTFFRPFASNAPLAEPRRIGLPTRHRYLPIRRGSRFSSLFASNYSLPLPSHVALDLQRDITTSQYDVAHVISPFFPQILLPSRASSIGLPTRHGLSTRRGAPFYQKPPALYGWLPIFFI